MSKNGQLTFLRIIELGGALGPRGSPPQWAEHLVPGTLPPWAEHLGFVLSTKPKLLY